MPTGADNSGYTGRGNFLLLEQNRPHVEAAIGWQTGGDPIRVGVHNNQSRRRRRRPRWSVSFVFVGH